MKPLIISPAEMKLSNYLPQVLHPTAVNAAEAVPSKTANTWKKQLGPRVTHYHSQQMPGSFTSVLLQGEVFLKTFTNLFHFYNLMAGPSLSTTDVQSPPLCIVLIKTRQLSQAFSIKEGTGGNTPAEVTGQEWK